MTGLNTFVPMQTFDDFKIRKQLREALHEMGIETPTPIQLESFSVIKSGRNVVGISQTGTGKTFAFLLPILDQLKYSDQTTPRVLIIVPTRELVVQTVDEINKLIEFLSIRALAVYGGANINTQKKQVALGMDILVSTPGRLYDLVLHGAVKLKHIKQLVIDEVDMMLDLGFRFQIHNILDLLPEKRQNIMFSATMTEEVSALIDDYFINPKFIQIALSGTPLENISQIGYELKNFYTKANMLEWLIKDKDEFQKVLVFTASKKHADRLFEYLDKKFINEMGVIHANKSQNYRLRMVDEFENGKLRVLISTDVMARGIDLDHISHVICMNIPTYPENYLHRIGRTGRAEAMGHSILLYTSKELEAKKAVEELMNYNIPQGEIPEDLEISTDLLPEERKKPPGKNLPSKKQATSGAAFHEKKEKNKKTNLGSKFKRAKAKKYKKPQKRGDKIQNMASKKRKKRKK